MPARQQTSAEDFLPAQHTIDALRQAARSCKGCDLYKSATQTVFGEGSKQARVMLVGEQPGDMEDRQGHPFVGPAGRILNKALAAADIPREQVYVTNAVKHFKWIQRGKRRMHQKPLIRQVIACQPWLRAELGVIRPKVIVCLGATAARSMLSQERGKFLHNPSGDTVYVTIHPSAIYRQRDSREQEKTYRHFLADIKLVRRFLFDRAS
jgi:DNA polymerase